SGQGSVDRVKDGTLVIKNNIFFNIKAGSTLAAICNVKTGQTTYASDMLSANANTIADPLIASISRTADGKLDPRIASGSPAYQNLAAYPSDSFWEKVNYKGAFSSTDNWMLGWTALDKYGFLKQAIVTAVDETAPQAFGLVQNFPNPFNPSTTISFNVVSPGKVKVSIYDVTGQTVATLVDGAMTSGSHNVVWNALGLGSGSYFYVLENGGKIMSRKMTLLK
ncbi:MAG: T9SS type A sorting domain-containing protein, partial [Candidatus Latescibacterota bacterium]